MSPVLFVAAHPDDETLAMGVAIAEHLATGQDVHVMWLTDGKGTGVIEEMNGVGVLPWWGVAHFPTDEGYGTLTPDSIGELRAAEALTAVSCLRSGYPGTITMHRAGMDDGEVTPATVEQAIRDYIDMVMLSEPVIRLKAHTWVTQLEPHPDHVAAGAAVKAMALAEPARFGDARYYVMPNHWADPGLSLIAEKWDLPADAGVSKRVVNACRAYGAWAPPHRLAIGMHSVPALFDVIMTSPKCMYHA